jgi:ATP-dependent DNA helicase RecQ
VEDALFEILREWRNQIASQKRIPAYTVLNNLTLEELSKSKPTELEELMEISGIGQTKLNKYGHTIIELIKKYIVDNQSTSAKKGATHLITYELYKEGLSPKEIAEKRDMQETTVFSHLAQLYNHGKDVDLAQYVSKPKLDTIKMAWLELGKPETLKELKAELGNDYHYGEIRIGITVAKKEETLF